VTSMRPNDAFYSMGR